MNSEEKSKIHFKRRVFEVGNDDLEAKQRYEGTIREGYDYKREMLRLIRERKTVEEIEEELLELFPDRVKPMIDLQIKLPDGTITNRLRLQIIDHQKALQSTPTGQEKKEQVQQGEPDDDAR